MSDLIDETLTSAEAVQRYLVASDDPHGEAGDIIEIAGGQPLRRTQLRDLLRLVYEQREAMLRAALDQQLEYGVDLQVPEDAGLPHQVTYRCSTLADAQAKAAGSHQRMPGDPRPPRIVRRLVGPWQHVAVAG